MHKSINDLTAALRELQAGPDISAGLGPQHVHYCWSHGVTSGQHHTSKNCRRHKDDHKEDATYESKQGGSNFRATNAGRRG
eukprot:6434130-Ditylum_brightwellii.AAC.1